MHKYSLHILEQEELARWDKFCYTYGTIYQTDLWQQFKNDWYSISHNQTYRSSHIVGIFNEKKTLICGMLFFRYTFFQNRSFLYIPWGPVFNNEKITDAESRAAIFEILFEWLKTYEKIEHIVFTTFDIRINSPEIEGSFTEEAMRRGFHSSDEHVMPNTIFLMDITSEDLIRKNINSKYRYRLKNKSYLRTEFISKISKEHIDAFYDLYIKTSEVKSFSTRSKEYITHLVTDLNKIDNHIIMTNVYYEEELVASSINTLGGKEIDYLYSGITKKQEYRNMYAGYVMVHETALWGSKHGYVIYNLWGGRVTADVRDPWKGFTDFKLNMGGKPEEHTGILTRYNAHEQFVKFIYKVIQKYIHRVEY